MRIMVLAPAALALASALPTIGRAADAVMVQCGQQYQAAKAAGTLGGADWSQFRTECAARLKAASAAPSAMPAPPPAVVAAPAAVSTPVAAPQPAAPTVKRPESGGMAAMHTRQKQCGAEWTAQKTALLAQTPGLTWPRYWSQCNTRLKAAGR